MSASDPVATLGLWIALILVIAKLGGDLAVRLRQPAVLGELLAGVALGSVPLPALEVLRADPYIDMLGRLGVLVLLFEVGLETTIAEVASVGFAAALVAGLGTAGTLVAGWAAAALTMPRKSTTAHLFVAAALTATSIGVSARVLRDSGASRSREAHTILGAAVIDDVLGLVVLAILGATIARSSAGAAPTAWGIAWLVAKTLGFLTLALLAGSKLAPLLFRLSSRLRSDGALVAAGLSFCFFLAWASAAIGLASIVGAFTAGLILEESHSAHFVERGEPPLSVRLEPISSWLVPIFFVVVGMRADLRALAHGPIILLAAALTAAAFIGKLGCALGAPRGTDRLAVVAGVLPRGEVSLVFAHMGLSLQVLNRSEYSAIVAVIVATTLATPAALRWRLERAS